MIVYDSALNVASAAMGAVALSASDEFFGRRDRLLSHIDPVFIPGKYDDNGKWMDGWESRRKRGPGHDWCIVRLACPALLQRADIDTSHFTGNYPKAAGLEAACLSGDPDEATVWMPLLDPVELAGNSHNIHSLPDCGVVTHIRLNIYPDGGVARLRLFGTPRPVRNGGDGLVDLAATLNGGRALVCNDAHFGDARNLLLPGVGARMEDGWETARRREPGNDWAIIALGQAGIIERIEVDTHQFKGNYPDSCSLQAAFAPDLPAAALVPQSLFWQELLPSQKLSPHSLHSFSDQIAALGPVSHVRFNVFPDGGVNRLRLFGRPLPQVVPEQGPGQ
ncbi:allantoicase [Insolitispirillum peregrinum]|uniref:allantoicase n=1 Tax=Insolitispirillum peregrinum TaxID=80876 RepID=UPI00360FFDFB